MSADVRRYKVFPKDVTVGREALVRKTPCGIMPDYRVTVGEWTQVRDVSSRLEPADHLGRARRVYRVTTDLGVLFLNPTSKVLTRRPAASAWRPPGPLRGRDHAQRR